MFASLRWDRRGQAATLDDNITVVFVLTKPLSSHHHATDRYPLIVGVPTPLHLIRSLGLLCTWGKMLGIRFCEHPRNFNPLSFECHTTDYLGRYDRVGKDSITNIY